MHFANQSEVLALIRLLQVWGGSGHPHFLGVLPDFKHWFVLLDLQLSGHFTLTVFLGVYWSCGWNVGFWIQRLMI